MIAQIVLYLLIFSMFSFWHFKPRYDTLISALLFASLSALLIYFIHNWNLSTPSELMFLWDSSRSGNLKISLASSVQNYNIIFPFFTITLIVLLNNLLSRAEKHKKKITGLCILNLISLIMLIGGNNFVQIITFVFISDILSQLLIDDVNASRRYSIYNLVADMGLFLVFAIIRPRLSNLDTSSFAHFHSAASTENLIILLILISLFIKWGFFIFHSYLLDMESAQFHRLLLIPYLSTPMVGLILFIKLKPLLTTSILFDTVFNIILALTIVWGAFGSVIMNNLKEKSIYLNMIILALLVKLAESPSFTWDKHFSTLLIIGCLFNYAFYYFAKHSRLVNANIFANQLSQSGKSRQYFRMFVCLGLMGCFGYELKHFYLQDNKTWIIGFAILFVSTIYLIFKQLFGNFRNNKQYAHWQDADIFPHFYEKFIARPIYFIGRILTIIIDFVFFERTFLAAFNYLFGKTVKLLRKINRQTFIRYVFCIMTAIGIFVWFNLKGTF